MHPDDLIAALRRQPFVPFRLHVSDGAAYDIRHPEQVLVTRRAAHVGVGGDGPIPDHAVIVALVHVSRLEELPAATPGNGAA
jgi:hypothetical protein